jgi:hypothetical protein
MEAMHLELEPQRLEAQEVCLAARLTGGAEPVHLWWRLPTAWAPALTSWADPFVVGLLFPMMQEGRSVIVEGAVSPSLLANLEEYMAIWHVWRPQKYRPIDIRGREEAEAPPPAQGGLAVVPFSCGIDSAYTVWRHSQRLAGRRSRRIGAGVVMEGFDIWLNQTGAAEMYAGLLAGARAMLDSLHLPCIALRTNFHELPTTWGDSFGTQLVGGLRLLAGRFDSALIAACVGYTQLGRFWAAHPVSDPFLSSRHFRVVDDACELGRVEKAEVLGAWPEAMRHLRVCFENSASHHNCCRCEKCLRSILAFRIGAELLPPAFARDASDAQICHVKLTRPLQLDYWNGLVRAAEARGLGEASWVAAARRAIRRGRRRATLVRLREPLIPWRNRVRRLFRGSSLSRRQLAAQAAARRTND